MVKLKDSLSLKKASIEGFRSIHSLDVEFKSGLNVLIGKNGAGKSNLLRILSNSLNSSGLAREALLKSLSLTLETADAKNRFEVDYDRKSVDPADVENMPSQKFFMDRKYTLNGEAISLKEIDAGGLNPSSLRSLYYFMVLRNYDLNFPTKVFLEYNVPNPIEYFDNAGAIVIDTNLKDMHYGTTLKFLNFIFWDFEMMLFSDVASFVEVDESVEEDETDTKVFAELLTLNYIGKYLTFNEGLKDALKKYTPIKDIRFNPNINLYNDDERIIIDNVKIDFFVNDNWYPWSHLSDGTKRLFYIIAEVESMTDGIVLLEEPELGIHPHQLHLLMQFLREQSEYNQIILSTHSPSILDHVDIEELDRILITSYERSAGTQIRRMSSAEMKKAKDYVDEVGYLSDFWVHSDLEQ